MSTDKLNAAIKRLLDIDPWDCTPDEINEAQGFVRIHMGPQPLAALDQPPAAGPTEDDFRAWWRERYNLSWAPSAGLERTATARAAFCLDRWGRPAAVAQPRPSEQQP
jgi:hypothetical protein